MTARTTLLAAASSVIASVALAACDSSPVPTAASTAGPTSAATTSSPPPASASPGTVDDAPSGTATSDLADGRHPVRVVRVDPAKRLVTVDVVQWFTGTAAASAAAQDGAAEVPPPNDYWIRNVNPRLRTLTVAKSAPITTNVLTAAESGSSTTDVPVDLDRLSHLQGLSQALFWLTVRDGVVTAVSEQFLP
jgi:hypothetical protein